MASVAPIFAARYIPGEASANLIFPRITFLAISVTALLFDHVLTLGSEIDLIWLKSGGGIGNRIGFIVNRYLTEAVAIYVAYCK
jgi:hypothetical protein